MNPSSRVAWLLPTLSAAALLACNKPKLDQDGDGFTELTGDCDDLDANVHPAAPEVCYNGIDDNCNGVEDEEGATSGRIWYLDVDGDGYGIAEASLAACDQPEGYAEDKWDCHDNDPLIHPTAIELCDYIDNDCDGQVDEATADDAKTWYPDRDGDGFGDDAGELVGCEAPAGYIETGGDCADLDPLLNPAATEDCRTTSDDDCDGLTNEPDAYGCTDYYADLDGDGYPGTGGCYCEAEAPYEATAPTDCDDTRAEVYPGAPSTLRWGPEDCGSETPLDLTTPDLDLSQDWTLDYTRLYGADFDYDGDTDLLVATRAGGTKLLQAPFDAADVSLEQSLVPVDSYGWGAYNVAFTPDYDGDGRMDVASYVWDRSTVPAGVYLFSSSGAAPSSHDDALGFWPMETMSWYMEYMAFTDLDGDGSIELLYTPDGEFPAVATLDPSGVLDTDPWDTYDFLIDGPCLTNTIRPKVADVNGDGLNEVILGRETLDEAGRTDWTDDRGSITIFTVESDRFIQLRYALHGWYAGAYEYELADVNGDGHTDIVAAAYSYLLESNSGQVAVMYGPLLDDRGLIAWDSVWEPDARISGTEEDDLIYLRGVGDPDGDGADEFVTHGDGEGTEWYVEYPAEGHVSITEVGRPIETNGGKISSWVPLTNGSTGTTEGVATVFYPDDWSQGDPLQIHLFAGDLP